MTKKTNETAKAVRASADGLAEIQAITDGLKAFLRDRIAALQARPEMPAADLNKKIGELYSAHLKLVEQEKTFHAKLGLDPDADAVDYDVIRAEIGRQLDRIRAARDAGEVAGGTE